jgi:hypothetical protein
MARIEILRNVTADPAGVALLLSGPAAAELWPRTGVQFSPPSRSGLGFVVDVRVQTLTGQADGRLFIVGGVDGPTVTELRLVLSAESSVTDRLRADAHGFVASLAATAQERSSAA